MGQRTDDVVEELGPKRLRRALERLGPTALKVGQFLSLRPDLIPQSYADELLELVDAVPTDPYDVIAAVIEEDLGPIEQTFAELSEEPCGSGSLAQVHQGRLLTGELVAVKVQRPGVRSRVRRDLRAASFAASIVQVCSEVSLVPPRQLVEEFRDWLEQELDLEREAQNTQRMGRRLAESAAVVPDVYAAASKGRVLTLEYVEGIGFAELLRWARHQRWERFEAHDIDRHRVAKRLLRSVLDQVFRQELFHADPHPGNLLALPDDVVGFLDFGLVMAADPTVRAGFSRYLTAVYDNDAEGMYRALTEILVVEETSDLGGFRRDFFAATAEWERRREAGASRHSPLATYLVAILTAARNNGLSIPVGVLGMYRAMVMAEGIAHQLSGEATLLKVGSRFFARLQLERFVEGLDMSTLQATAADLLALLADGPAQVRRLLADVSDDRFELAVSSHYSPAERRAQNDRYRLVAVSIALVALALLAVGTAAPTWLTWGGFGIALGIWCTLFYRLG